jgi:hypothetical protein
VENNIIIAKPYQTPKSLAELAAQIDAEHDRAEKAIHDALAHARGAGALLAEAKARVPHGEWLGWLKAHCNFTPRTAQRYMQLAEHWEEIVAKGGEGLNLNGALKLLAHEKEEADGSNATRVSHLPPALAYYCDHGLISEEALGLLLKLEDDYGPNVMTYLPFSRVSERVMRSWAFLNGIRPLDHPPLWPFPVDENVATPGAVAVVAATKIFVEDGCTRGDKVPQWEVTAFWFASTMVHMADAMPEFAEQFESVLRIKLEEWRAFFLNAIYIVGCLGRPFLMDPDGEELWLGYLSDIQHAGARPLTQDLNKDPHALRAVVESLEPVYRNWERDGCFMLPSGMQGRLDRFPSSAPFLCHAHINTADGADDAQRPAEQAQSEM